MKNQNVFKAYSPRHHMRWSVAQCRDCSHKKEDDLYKYFKINLSFQKFAIEKIIFATATTIAKFAKKILKHNTNIYSFSAGL